jgi:Queuosine biosynthesis protein QueC
MSLIKNRLIVECGPSFDRRTLNIYLHPIRKRIGVLVSGGMDSALLYYLLVKLNVEQGFTHTVTPYTILRKDGSPQYAQSIIDYVHDLFQLPYIATQVVGDPTLHEGMQVESGAKDVLLLSKSNVIYLGLIEELAAFTIGWRDPIKWTEPADRRYPLMNLNKSHIVDLIIQFKQEKLFEMTHSCNMFGKCNNCNGCNERSWGFKQMGYTDPGIL